MNVVSTSRRALTFAFASSFLCPRIMGAQPQQPATDASPSCSVRRIDNEIAAASDVSFSGRVQEGKDYQCTFIQGLVFQLMPIDGGWLVVIHRDNDKEDVAEPASPFNGRNPLKIVPADFRSRAQDGDVGSTRSLPDERSFVFSRAGRSHGSVKIIDLKVEGDERADIAEMDFDVSIQLPTLDGVPIYLGFPSGVTPPKPISTPDPEYADEARKRHIHGSVTVCSIVGLDGRPRNVRVTRSLDPGLDAKAVEAVRGWRFKPAILNGKPVPFEISVVVDFHLNR